MDFPNWYDQATGKFISGRPVIGVYFEVPLTGNCYGTWTRTFTFSQTFTDGQTLVDSVSGTFPVTGPPPAPPVPATYGSPAAAPDGSGVCGNPRYEYAPRVQAACAAIVAEPVNLATGAETVSVTDAQLPSLGEPFRFVRSYTSLDTTAGELGVGWTDSYNSNLVFGTGQVTLRAGSGAQTVFTQQANGSYVAPVWSTLSLTASGGGYDLVTPDQIHYGFDGQGRLISIKDRNGEGVAVGYDAQGKRSTLTDSAGRQVSFGYDAGGHLATVTLPDGRFVGYGYTNNLLTSVTDLAGNTYTYTYDGGNRLQSEVDQNQHQVFFNTYNAGGQVLTQEDANQHTTTYTWSPNDESVSVRDARSHFWHYTFTGITLLASVSTPVGGYTAYGYDNSTGDLTSIKDSYGNTETMTYDGRHNMLTRTAPAPLSYQETWTYNTRNDPLTYKDGRGNQTDYGYDAASNLTSVTGPDPDGSGPLGRPTTTYTRDPAGTGLVLAVTDPRSKTTTLTYDPTTHEELSETTPLGEKTTFTYDPAGRLQTSVDPRGNITGANPTDYTTTYAWDGNDHVTEVTSPDPDGTGPQAALVSQWTYDPVGNLQTVTDPAGNATAYGYDDANNLTSVTTADPDGVGPLLPATTSYTYDEVGNVLTRTVAATHTTTYGYDNANHLISVTTPTNQLWTYTYDLDGNLTSQTDANGNASPTTGDGVTNYGYDALGRLASIGYSDTTPDVTFGYDANNNLTAMTDGAGSETRTFDALNHLTSVMRDRNTFTYTYDAGGNLTQTKYPDKTTIAASYNNDSQLASVLSDGLTTNYAYDPAGNPTTTTLPAGNGYIETRGYDRAGRLISLSNKKGSSTLSAFGYTLDPDGNPTAAVVTRGAASETDTYSYDNVGRITGVCYQASCPLNTDPFIRWTYDDVGNRLTQQTPTGTVNYSYDASDELLQAGTTVFGYDANGNETSSGSQTFSYDLANRLKSTTNAGTTTTYSYDGLGKRLQAAVGSTSANFLWDTSRQIPQIALEQDARGRLIRRYAYGAKRLSMNTGSTPYFFQYDPLGSVVNLTNSSGATEWTDAYDPFGTVHGETKNDTNAPTNVFKFAGEYLDPTGLYHLRARQYDTATGRFLKPDPANPAKDNPYLSTYSYANDAPTSLIDPTGMGAIGDPCGSSIWCWVKSGGPIGNPPCASGVGFAALGGFVVVGFNVIAGAHIILGAGEVAGSAESGPFAPFVAAVGIKEAGEGIGWAATGDIAGGALIKHSYASCE